MEGEEDFVVLSVPEDGAQTTDQKAGKTKPVKLKEARKIQCLESNRKIQTACPIFLGITGKENLTARSLMKKEVKHSQEDRYQKIT